MYYYFPSFTLYDQHVVLRRIIHSHVLYDDVLGSICSIEIGYFMGGLWGKPHDSWWALLTPCFIFMFPYDEMIVAANKWLGKHFFFSILMQVVSALCRFHEWNYDPLSSCHMTACSYLFFLPCVAKFSF